MERFELLYETVDDIDLYIGGVSERPVVGAVTGPTFQVKLRSFSVTIHKTKFQNLTFLRSASWLTNFWDWKEATDIFTI